MRRDGGTARARSGPTRRSKTWRRTEARAESAHSTSLARSVRPSSSVSRDAEGARRGSVAAHRPARARARAQLRGRLRAERLPAGPLLDPGNHAHLIVEADDEGALGRGMKALGSRLARAVNRIFGRSGPCSPIATTCACCAPARSAERARLRAAERARHAARAGRALSRAFGIDPASSGRWFDGWRHAICAVGPSPPVHQPGAGCSLSAGGAADFWLWTSSRTRSKSRPPRPAARSFPSLQSQTAQRGADATLVRASFPPCRCASRCSARPRSAATRSCVCSRRGTTWSASMRRPRARGPIRSRRRPSSAASRCSATRASGARARRSPSSSRSTASSAPSSTCSRSSR